MAASVFTVKPIDKRIEGLKFVHPDTGETYEFWIKVKRRLNVGEARKMNTAGFGGVRRTGDGDEDPEIQMDWQAMSFARAEVYLTDWSLEDEEKAKLKITREQIEALHPECFKSIEDAISKHVEEMDAEKNARTGSNKPELTSA